MWFQRYPSRDVTIAVENLDTASLEEIPRDILLRKPFTR
ncbi:Uncharacterised protein [Chlamydia trachomatis]|nr:Uncharacterised protein [Chlamydia trachomatis]